jgi:hypothetical protein
MHRIFISASALIIVATAARGETLHIGWPELRGASARIANESVKIEGYLLPADRDGDLVYEFMLVPYPGACSHMPQPPPDQIIRVLPEKPYKARENYETVSVVGRLKKSREQTQLFMIDGVKVVDSGYSIGQAEVMPAPPSFVAPRFGTNPLLSKRR